MFTISIKSEQISTFTLNGTEQSLATAIAVLASGFQNRQSFVLRVCNAESMTIQEVSKASDLPLAFTDAVFFLNKKWGENNLHGCRFSVDTPAASSYT